MWTLLGPQNLNRKERGGRAQTRLQRLRKTPFRRPQFRCTRRPRRPRLGGRAPARRQLASRRSLFRRAAKDRELIGFSCSLDFGTSWSSGASLPCVQEESRLAWLGHVSLGLHSLVVNPKQSGGGDTDGGDRPPDALRLVLDFAEVMHEPAAEASADQRAYPDGQECEAHIRAALPRRRESRDVFVIAWRLDDFPEGDDHQCGNRRPHTRVRAVNAPP